MHGWTFIISWEFTDRAETYCILALETSVMWVLHLIKLSRESWHQIIVQPQCGLNRQTTAITFSFSFFFVSMCRNFLRDKQFRSGPDAATHLYTALHTQVMFEYEWSQTVSAAPEMKMIVFLQDPVKMDQSLPEHLHFSPEEMPN